MSNKKQYLSPGSRALIDALSVAAERVGGLSKVDTDVIKAYDVALEKLCAHTLKLERNLRSAREGRRQAIYKMAKSRERADGTCRDRSLLCDCGPGECKKDNG